MPMTDDILECQLQPLRRATTRSTFTDAQWQQLKETFPHGVCNYNERGVDQRGAIPWLTYQRANGQRDLRRQAARARRVTLIAAEESYC